MSDPSAPALEIEDDKTGSNTEQTSTAQIKRHKGYQVDQAETGGPAAANADLKPLPAFAGATSAILQPPSAVLQPLPAFSASGAANFAVFAAGGAANFAAAAASNVPVVSHDVVKSANPQSLVVLDLTSAHCF